MSDGMMGALASFVGGALGVPTEFGEWPRADACAMVRVAPGEPYASRYRSGGGIRQLTYEVYLRTNPRSEADRVSGAEALAPLAEAIASHEYPVADLAWCGHEVTGYPSPYAVEPSGATVHQLIARLRWLEG